MGRRHVELCGPAAAVLVLAACGGMHVTGIGDPPARTGPILRAGALAVTTPKGFLHYEIRGGIHKRGTLPPAVGVLVTDYRLNGHRLRREAFEKWGSSSESPPAHKVALELTLWEAIGPQPAAELHLPLSLGQRWFEERPKHGTRRYRWGYLRFQRRLYEVFFWSGKGAPGHDRAAIARALTSISRWQ